MHHYIARLCIWLVEWRHVTMLGHILGWKKILKYSTLFSYVYIFRKAFMKHSYHYITMVVLFTKCSYENRNSKIFPKFITNDIVLMKKQQQKTNRPDWFGWSKIRENLEFGMGFRQIMWWAANRSRENKIDFNPLFWERAGRTGDERTTEQCVMWPPEGHILFTFVARKIFSDFS